MSHDDHRNPLDPDSAVAARIVAPDDPGALARLRRSLADRADAEGLLDVAWAWADSPLGRLLLAASPRGLLRVAYVREGDPAAVLEALARSVSPQLLERPARLDAARRQLDEYFAGHRHRFDLTTDPVLVRGFARRVLEHTAEIPFGDTCSYAQVAVAAGSPRGARAAGNALGANPLPIVIPCHRVLHAGGRLGGYTGGTERKRLLLELEGVAVG